MNLKAVPLGLLVAGAAISLFAQNGSLDASFQAEVNATVLTVVVQPDGKILIGGDFTSVNGVPRSRIARLNDDGELDPEFDPGQGASAAVYAIALQSDGRILVGGYFQLFAGATHPRLVRLNTNGTLDASFALSAPPTAAVRAICVQTNQQILIGGDFGGVNNTNRSHLARLNLDGKLDEGFDAGDIGSIVRAVALQGDGRILIGGNFSHIGLTPRPGVAMLKQNGALDIGFYPTSVPISIPLALLVRSDGRIVLGGPRGTSPSVAQLEPNGTFDPSFSPNVAGSVQCFALASGDKVLLGGDITSVDGQPRTRLARLDAEGNLDASFTPGLVGASVNCLTVQPNGKILVGGDFTSVNGVTRIRIARLNADVASPAASVEIGMYAGLTINGEIGRTYRVEYSDNLTNPISWQTLEDIPLTNTPFFYLDRTSPYSTKRFYRAVALP